MGEAKIRVGVNGAAGRMGKVVLSGIEGHPRMETAFAADAGDDLSKAVRDSGAQVVVDFTVPAAVFENTLTVIREGARPVVGTTGLSGDQLKIIDEELNKRGLGGIVAPNFSLGALLMMKLARETARYMDRCEIIELHHDQKIDSPSGTSLLTAEQVGEALAGKDHSKEPLDGEETSRGMKKGSVRIHSVRLPGRMAHQQVIFGGQGETLTIAHDAISRECFIPGILMAIEEVLDLQGLRRGLKI